MPIGNAPQAVEVSATAVEIAAERRNRTLLAVYNDSTADAYLMLGDEASTDLFTVKIIPDGYYEVPGRWLGTVSVICVGGGAGEYLMITELHEVSRS